MARMFRLVLTSACLVSIVVAAAVPHEAEAPALSAEEMKPYVETIPGTKVKFEMIPIHGGTYLMGSPEDEPDRNDDEGPQHLVTVRPFWMGKCEVTWSEFDIYANSTDIRAEGEGLRAQEMSDVDGVTKPTAPYTDMTFGHGFDHQPAICMSHHAAMQYCRWLSGKTKKWHRLPTEAEWEYACRAGTTTAYSWGDSSDKIDEYAWYLDNAYVGDEDVKPQPVGKKKPNPWGLHDIHGNVSEWCVDHYDEDSYKNFKRDVPSLSPVLLPTAKKFAHVVRGGSWDDEAFMLRSAARRASNREWLRQDPQRPQSIWWLTDAQFVGFRVIRPLEEQENLKGLKSKVKKE